jgi:peptidoglycan/xylan/chitin deacetylase (PgdA/CDA1 family)
MTGILDKIRREWVRATVLRRFLGTGPAGRDSIGLVVYLDYEREFGNTAAKEPARRGFESVVSILHEHGMRATWNCVGLVGLHYPETVERLIEEGHEIACHTHSHISPSRVCKSDLHADIAEAKSLFKERFGVDLRGFHSPSDAWSRDLIGVLLRLGFEYDIAYERQGPGRSISLISDRRHGGPKGRRVLLRVPSAGDDWSLFCGDRTPEEIRNGWAGLLTPGHRGETFALGFHPWILGMREGHMRLFRDFVEKVSSLGYVRVLTGREVAEWAGNDSPDTTDLK